MASGFEGSYGERRQMIEEVTVTSQKRAVGLSVQDVPSAISAFGEFQIKGSFSVDLVDIGRMVPNANLANVGTYNSYPNFFIRGIGVNGSTRSMDPAVGIIVDGMYLGYPAGSLLTTFDREAVEVLRGPQGTLLGRNVTGGAVLVRTKRPSGEYGFTAEATLGNYHQAEYAASVEGPIGEKMAVKLAGVSAYRDGFYKDNNGGRVDPSINPSGMPDSPTLDKSETDYWLVRPVISFRPTEALDLTLIAEYLKDEGGSAASQNVVNPFAPKLAQTLFGYFPPDDKYKINHDLSINNDIEIWSAVLEGNWDLGHGVLTSVTGRRDVQYDSSTDFDGTPFPIFHFPFNEEDQDQFSQELRYASKFSDRYDFVLGLYYFEQEYTVGERRTVLGRDSAAKSEISHENYAIFGEANYLLTERARVTFGARYTVEEKSISYSPPGTCSLDFADCAVVIRKDDDWDNVSPKLALSYDFTDRLMVYGSWTRGFRSGGYNARATREETLGPADEETVTSYEVGLKSSFLDGRGRFNAALFLMEYEDIQQFVNNPSSQFGAELLYINAADARIPGFEAEFQFAFDNGLTLDANLGYVDPEFRNFGDFDVDGDGQATAQDKKIAEGLDFVKVPKWTFFVAASHELSLAEKGRLVSRLAYSWRDSFYTDFRNDPFLRQDSYGLLDGSITYLAPDGKVEVSVFGKNLTDEEFFDYAANVATLDSARWGGFPRLYGVKFTYRY
ncbi:MAG: TonB-dependent receptor [Porticoccaceae bacterium]|nr:MAG: TonB-dependent receptor [Porticoccaceae bacterium]